MKLSVIIPALNEAALIEKTLSIFQDQPGVEVIVVDGGSQDETSLLAKKYTDKVFSSPPGRARQMNVGARHAAGETLLFLHADSLLNEKGLFQLQQALAAPGVVGGAFRLAIDSQRLLLRWIAAVTNLRAVHFKMPYGDQGIFVRRKVFEDLGGYHDLPIMEDVELWRRLKKKGPVVILHETVITSSRRWDREGFLYTTLRNWFLMILFLLGVKPATLVRWYKDIR